MADVSTAPAEVQTAYRQILQGAMTHGSETSRNLAAILLGSYNERMAGVGFVAGRFRAFDRSNQQAVLVWLDWFGAGSGRYPNDDDMDRLKVRWAEMGWDRSEPEGG